MIWYRGTDGSPSGTPCGVWYAAERQYAEFFGGTVVTVASDGLRILDLRGLGLGAPEQETYLRVERAAARLSLRYDAVRVMQWHADYSGDAQDTLLVL